MNSCSTLEIIAKKNNYNEYLQFSECENNSNESKDNNVQIYDKNDDPTTKGNYHEKHGNSQKDSHHSPFQGHKNDHNCYEDHNHEKNHGDGHKHEHEHSHDHDYEHNHDLDSSNNIINHSENCSKFEKTENDDFNLKSAIAHVQGDLVFSIGVFIGAILINIFPKARFIDPIITLGFSIIVLKITIPIFKESIKVLLDGASDGKFSIFQL